MQHVPPVCKVQAKWTEMLTRLAAASAFSASQAAALALWVASARSLRICSSIFSSKSLRKLQHAKAMIFRPPGGLPGQCSSREAASFVLSGTGRLHACALGRHTQPCPDL